MFTHTTLSKIFLFIKWVCLYLTGPFLGIVAFWIDNKSLSIETAKPASLLLALFGYLVGQHVVQGLDGEQQKSVFQKSVDRIMDKLEANKGDIKSDIAVTAESFRTHVNQLFKVSHIPDSAISETIASSIRTAYHVKNTYVGISPITGLRTSRNPHIISYYEELLSKDKDVSWQDIVGVAEFLDGRYDAINANGNFDIKGQHDIFLVTSNVPVLNFVLIGPRQSLFDEVYFGWVKNSSSDVDVFYSRDTRLISMFNNYFEALKTARGRTTRIPISYADKPGERLNRSVVHRFRGTWISISRNAKGNTGQVLASDQGKSDLQAYAIINIDYEDDWIIKGETYKFLSHEILFVFDSEMCSLRENTLYYVFNNRDKFRRSESSGTAAYTLALPQEGDFLTGYYIRNDRKPYGTALLDAQKIDLERVNDFEYRVSIIRNLLNRK